MKRVKKILTALWIGALLAGFFITRREKRKEYGEADKIGKGSSLQENKRAEKHQPYGYYEAYLKRPLDFALVFTALLFLWPVYIILAVAVKKKLGSPVIFTQERPGKDGKIFKLYKFRTMTDERDENGVLLPDQERLPEFGRKLRSTSLDELPELFNILKGEMALVGPRPLLVEYLPRYNERQARRHEVRPGLTGLAQVSGRNKLSWEEKFEDDVKYVDHVTFWTDMKILFRTAAAVFRRDGISSATSVTMEDFMGSGEGEEQQVCK